MADEFEFEDSLTPQEPIVAVPTESDLQEQNKRLYARAKQAEEELKKFRAEKAKELKQIEIENYKEEVAEVKADVAPPGDIEDLIDLRVSGYSRQEIDFMRNYAKGLGKSLATVVNDPFVLAGIEGLRAKQRVESATPNPSSRSVVENPTTTFAKLPQMEQRRKWTEALQKRKGLGDKFA